ncbi:MAG: DNA repair protein RadC [Firmicutes bacterium]|nr:DNA repair protein RadC [Bacillota bacterium]
MKEMPAQERPRERLLRAGPEALSSAELVSIILGTGVRGQTALSLAGAVLRAFGGLRGIAAASTRDLASHKGIGPAKAVQLKAAMELGRRAVTLEPEELVQVSGPRDVASLLMGEMRYLDREHFRVVLLNAKHRIIDVVTVSVGCLDSSLVHPREVFKECLKRNSACVILVHNHPSGDPTPSGDDIAITRRLASSGLILGIEVLDHIIVGDNRYSSLKELGLMTPATATCSGALSWHEPWPGPAACAAGRENTSCDS